MSPMLTQSGEEVNHVRSKGYVSALLFTLWFRVVFFKVDAFRKKYNNVNGKWFQKVIVWH